MSEKRKKRNKRKSDSMPINEKASISKNLTISLVLMVLAVSVIPVCINYVHSSRKAKAQLEEKADEYITFLVNSLEMPLWLLDDKSIQHIGRFFAKNELVVELKITGYDNRILLDMRKKNDDDVIIKEKTVSFNNKGASGNIRLALSYRYYRELSNNLILSSLITIIVILIFLTFTTSVLLKVFLRKPIMQLNQIAKAYALNKSESSEYHCFYCEFEPFVTVLEKMGTEIRSRIEELRNAEKKYRDIFENAIEGIFQTTPDGQIVSVNPAMIKIMGYDSQEDLLLSVPDVSHQFYANSDDRQEFIRILNQNSKVVGFETQMRRKDNSLIMVSISARTVRDEQDNVLYYEGSLADITERIRREKAEREREIADAANQTKSRFLAHISHELRTPLNSIIGYAQILNKTPYATQFQKERLDTIQKSGEHLLMLLNDILDLSKIEAGCMNIRPVDFCLPDFLTTLMTMFQVRAFHKNILFDYEIADSLPEIVKGDEIRLRQILINLLGNAVKFTEKGRVTFKTDYHDGRVFFEITDTGLGIDTDELEKIFDPFYQSGAYLKKTEGTGLGLSISKKLLEMMKGELTLHSTPGQGTIFRVDMELPPADSVTDVLKTEHSEMIGYQGMKRRILVADDIAHHRSLLSDLLIPLGFEMIEADNGEKAVEKAKEFQPDVIFMDLFMPHKDGFEATRQIRAMIPRLNVIIFAICSGAFEEYIQKSRDAGCDDFIPKPIVAKDVLEKLKQHLAIEWIYQDSESEKISDETTAPMLPPSADELEALISAARIGDIAFIRQKVESLLRQKDTRLTAFAKKLLQLVRGFHIDKIRVFLKSFQTEQKAAF
jgi:PAS domain S-box-containing protein